MAEDKGLTRAQREEKILQFWKENKIFSKTLSSSKGRKEFVFYEGPPTANGKPGIHHLESRAFKDAIPRYKTMRGFHVPRQAGWDTHGLPVELEVEKELGLKSKKEIEEFGVAEFNKKCKESVGKYIGLWEKFTDRIGYWVNLDEAYYTYRNSYIESVWKVISHTDERGLLYKDYKVVPWCPRCGTALSSHELAQGYADVKDLSLYVKFPVKGQENTYLIAWTTTPWTLPGNVALAVGPDIDYVKVKQGEEMYILAEARLPILEGEYEIVEKAKGRDLIGLEYEPLYPFVTPNDKTYKVYAADFVTTEDGTGIVHTAVMYGQEDFDLGTRVGLPKHHLVSPDGLFTKDAGHLAGKSVLEESTAVEILKDLQSRGKLFKKESHTHSYPFCWRCKTRLIYYARDSWYIRMSELRDELVKENEKINWVPEHVKEGRFGEWLREVKDWAISRERYWGTPLPVWISSDGNSQFTISNLQELRKYIKGSGNKYFVMRHGEAENNVRRIVSVHKDNKHGLTELGRQQAQEAAEQLKDAGIDVIVSSPFVRTRETAEAAARVLGIASDSIILDERLGEFDAGEFEGKSEDELHDFLHSRDMFRERCPGGENFSEAKKRLGQALDDIEREHSGKRVLFVTHKICAWLLSAAASRLNGAEAEALDIYLKNAGLAELDDAVLPHNDEYELDLHKPYIDEVVLEKDGKEYRRTKEVMDVWLDSGSMPFAAGVGYPADFISEGLDQTRGWFYTLHAVGSLMKRGRAYKNVICLGLILDGEGKKMSKSVGNIVEPFAAIEKYGVDTLRLWMYSVNQPGENKNFDERTVEEVGKRVFNILDNVYAFYELYRDGGLEVGSSKLESSNILDKWILTRLDELTKLMTSKLETYQLLEPVREMRGFLDDLSTWYLRRSRERLKQGDAEAKRTLYFALKTISKLLAPFAPFAAEELFQKLRLEGDPESVHLCDWPLATASGESFFSRLTHRFAAGSRRRRDFGGQADADILKNMSETRRIVSLALEARSRANIKIRQPLSRLEVKSLKLGREYLELIKDEVNVKEVIEDSSLSEEIRLETTLTPELEEEGMVREVMRRIQDLRKERGLKPVDIMRYEVPAGERELVERHAEEITCATNTELVTR